MFWQQNFWLKLIRVTIANAGKDEEQLELTYIGGMYSGTNTVDNNLAAC